ncbi:UbiD family decarboxylase [Glycomyces luteolus]|uniref:UbiD family decarboxylase n=1 Tax=Glycomyces luteolus TaxID=2670330 RepID=A0A9X3SRP2_9ACTN|nr:UbiD family decarboxylase [Glycomyces luteolus]MDA1361857.1 UbiD family decarboxylase [Glycomyces luteolus]
MKAEEIEDLRSALEFLTVNGEAPTVVEEPLSPVHEIAAHHAAAGGGVPSQHNLADARPTIYSNPVGFDVPVVMGVHGRRADCAAMIGMAPERIALDLAAHVNADHPPARVQGPPPCQEVVLDGPDLDVRRVIPALTHTPQDAGPYITMGLMYAVDEETGEQDVTIHRLCLQGPNTLSAYFVPGRHIDRLRRRAVERGGRLPITISIGLDPAIYLVAAFTYPTTPFGFNELNVAGSIRGRGVPVCEAATVPGLAIANAEIVIEGYLSDTMMREHPTDDEGGSLPEFLGYQGSAQSALPRVEVTAVTHRRNPLYQCLLGPGSEQSNILALPTEASLYQSLTAGVTGSLVNCHCPHHGGGKLSAVLQFDKTGPVDDATARQAGLAAFAAFHELKHVYLVDRDVDLFSEQDVLWAMTTRFQADTSLISVPFLNGHPLDPSQNPQFNPANRHVGTTTKAVFDCTAPFEMRRRFRRADFLGGGAS